MIVNELKQHGTADFPFELYQVDRRHPRYVMTFHWHVSVELIRVLSGELTLTLDHRAQVLHAGDFALINSETVHGATPNDCVYDVIVFDLAFLKTGNPVCDGFIDDLLSHAAFLLETPTNNEVKRALDNVFEQMRYVQTGAPPFKALGAFLDLLGEIERNDAFTSQAKTDVYDEKRMGKLKATLEYLRTRYADEITLDELSAVAGFSRKYFCKFFKDMTGTTPFQYLTTYRIEKAARKLLITKLPVTQIAFDCGFNDLSYFIKTFKQLKGVSPNKYRKT